MYIKAQPVGVTPPATEDQMPIWRAESGDDLWLTTRMTLEDKTTPVTPENSKLKFVLADTRFSTTPIWTGIWHEGIEEVDRQNQPGLIKIKIPDAIGASLRRGVYNFSILVTNRFGTHGYVGCVGSLLMEYETASPQHDIPYKHCQDWGFIIHPSWDPYY